MLPKPELYSSHYGTWFQDPLVVAAYPARPPYPESAIRLLAQLAVDQPRRVLDIGCGTGDISRRLAQLVECVDAVDASERMLAAGRRASGGDAANINWIHARVEDILPKVEPPYALISAGESLHWMEWHFVMPLFADLLTPNGVLAIVSRNWDGPPELRERLQPIFRESPLIRVWQTVNLIDELTGRHLFRKLGQQHCGPDSWQPTIDEYVEARYSQRSFSRTHMGPQATAAFDNSLREMLEELIARGTVACVDGRLQLLVESTVVWGLPAGAPG